MAWQDTLAFFSLRIMYFRSS